MATCRGMIEYDRRPDIEYYHLLYTKPVHGRYSISGGILYTKTDEKDRVVFCASLPCYAHMPMKVKEFTIALYCNCTPTTEAPMSSVDTAQKEKLCPCADPHRHTATVNPHPHHSHHTTCRNSYLPTPTPPVSQNDEAPLPRRRPPVHLRTQETHRVQRPQ